MVSNYPERDFPRGSVVRNLPCNAGDMGSMSGLGTKIPHTMGAAKPTQSKRSGRLQLRPDTDK